MNSWKKLAHEAEMLLKSGKTIEAIHKFYEASRRADTPRRKEQLRKQALSVQNGSLSWDMEKKKWILK